MRDCIFRKYDIRGIVDKDLIISEVYNLGRALAYYLLKRKPSLKSVVIGMDGRVHSPLIKDELTRAFCDSGLDVWFIGICPTPVLYFSLYTGLAEAGVMITASHNDKEYNGFKICVGNDLLSAAEIAVLKDLYKRKARIHTGRAGLITKSCLSSYYIAWLLEAFNHLKNSSIAAVIDCGNGATGSVVVEIVKRMGWQQVSVLHEQIDGNFPHRSPDPTQENALTELAEVVRLYAGFKQAHTAEPIGAAFDGDGDRMVGMTHTGRVLSGDILLMLFSKDLAERHAQASVVFDSKCSQLLGTVLHEWGMIGHRAPTGHASVKQKMNETGALLAGELSCHFMFKDRYFGYDDGIYAMLRLLEILHIKSTSSLESLVQAFPTSYKMREMRIPCSEENKEHIIKTIHTVLSQKSNATLCTLDGIRMETPYGWGLLRASNTEPIVSLCCESLTLEGLELIKEDFSKALASIQDSGQVG